LDAGKHELERRLAQLNGRIEHKQEARRPYPKVHPKYRNPERPSETWSGRGKQPHWVGAQLRTGKKIDDLLISQAHWDRGVWGGAAAPREAATPNRTVGQAGG
jgi:DNA-binding protein H-NS